MEELWRAIARRIVEGLCVESGNLILVRDHTARPEALIEILLAIEERGGTPLTEIVTADYLARLLRTAPIDHLATWDRHRLAWTQQADRVLVLEGAVLTAEGAPPRRSRPGRVPSVASSRSKAIRRTLTCWPRYRRQRVPPGLGCR